MKNFKIALVGNTNAGKTTFLNTICGTSQETSNYPGTTVKLFKARAEYKKIRYEIIDLPGTYSLTPFSDEEKVAREILESEKFDLIVQVIEPNLKKRSLAFTLELMTLGIPLFIVINNKDGHWKQADCFLYNLKKELLISGISLNVLDKKSKDLFFIKIQNEKASPQKYKNVLKKIPASVKRKGDKDYNLEIINNRFYFLEKHLSSCLGLKNKCTRPHFISDKIDKLLLNKFLGIPVFLIVMWIVFQAAFTLSVFPMDLIDYGIGSLQGFLTNVLPQNLWSSALIDGAIGGVGAMLIFLAPIMLLFFFLSLLQQSGYLARTAYLLDNMMQKIGLGGKSFVPLLMGFGCSVPAIMATRTLSSKKEKIITAMMIPFMSCGAKLPVYTLFIAAFFPVEYRGSVLFIIYLFGILMGIFSGFFFNKFIKGKKRPLLLELPAYTIPRLKNVWSYVWNSAKEFLFKAGKVILPFSIVLWFLFSFPLADNGKADIGNSYAATIGKTVEPIFEPLGFDWRISTGLIAGLGAKEIFVSSFGTMYSLESENEEGLILKLQNDPVFSLPTVISLLIFVLIYSPCIAVIGVLRQELGIKWALVGLIYPIVLAWGLSFLAYQIGQMF